MTGKSKSGPAPGSKAPAPVAPGAEGVSVPTPSPSPSPAPTPTPTPTQPPLPEYLVISNLRYAGQRHLPCARVPLPDHIAKDLLGHTVEPL